MTSILKAGILVVVSGLWLGGQTITNGGRVISGNWDAGNAAPARPVKTGTGLPAPAGTVASTDLSDSAGLERTANKNAASGYAGLDATGRIAKAQAPAATVCTDAANTFTGGAQDFSSARATLPVKAGRNAQAPATCAANKELYIKTQATAGRQPFICNGAGNGWTLVGDGAGGGSPGGGNTAIQYNGGGAFAGTTPNSSPTRKFLTQAGDMPVIVPRAAFGLLNPFWDHDHGHCHGERDESVQLGIGNVLVRIKRGTDSGSILPGDGIQHLRCAPGAQSFGAVRCQWL
jgi:hypothetical protein